MTKYTVYLTTTASLAVTVEIDDEGMDLDAAQETAIEQAYDAAPPEVCARCSGWGKGYGLDLGEWELERETPVEKKA